MSDWSGKLTSLKQNSIGEAEARRISPPGSQDSFESKQRKTDPGAASPYPVEKGGTG